VRAAFLATPNLRRRDANTFASWEIDYVKMDWCGDVKKRIWEGAKDYKAFSEALNHTSRPIFFECVAGFLFLIGEVPEYCNSWRADVDHHDSWKTTKGTITAFAAQKAAGLIGKPGAWPYLDILTTGGQGCSVNSTEHCPGQTETEYQTEFTMWSVLQSPLMVGSDVRNMTAVMKQALLNQDILTAHQDTRTPPGRKVATWLCSEVDACHVYGRNLADGSALVVLLNLGSKTHTITAKFDKLGWRSGTKAHAKDLWTKKTSDTTDEFTAQVASHGVVYV